MRTFHSEFGCPLVSCGTVQSSGHFHASSRRRRLLWKVIGKFLHMWWILLGSAHGLALPQQALSFPVERSQSHDS